MAFHHPYTPYDIQLEFMQGVYDCLEEGKVGIFESPTGTGKTLSIICASLTWLRDHKRKEFDASIASVTGTASDPDWVLENARQEKRRMVTWQRDKLEEKLARVREKEASQKRSMLRGEPSTKYRRTGTQPTDEPIPSDERFLPDDYLSGDEDVAAKRESKGLTSTDGPVADDEDDWDDEFKIYFCSRTHSQLTQFAEELRKVKLPPALPPIDAGETHKSDFDSMVEHVRHLTLASRKNLCINSKVSRLENASAINERCLELQDSKTSANHKCQFAPSADQLVKTRDFRDHALATIRDIEDLAKLGKELATCPYYATRASVKPAEIVTLPYPLLLQREARDALGISLKGHVVIIDEAHNLMSAIEGLYSSQVSLSQLTMARSQLLVYIKKFSSKLKGSNRVYVTQLFRLVDSVRLFMVESAPGLKNEEGLVNMSQMLVGKGVDQINLYKLTRYLNESKLARKVDGYLDDLNQQQKFQRTQGIATPKSTPVLMQIQSFLLTLMNPTSEGQFLFSSGVEKDDPVLRYMLLDPTQHFKQIVDEARAVILAGGTMSPMSDYTQQLFSYLDPHRLKTVSCGHVIPSSNLIVVPVTKTKSGSDFDFTFANRKTTSMINELGEAILDFSATIPDGVVVFFPSYAYLDLCKQSWKTSASTVKSIWDRLSATKPIFTETQSGKQSTKPVQQTPATSTVLDAYSAAVTNPTTSPGRGALLLAVIGGALSEGINFSDRLGRGVAVVGLPFPNPHSAEWKAKMGFVARAAEERASVEAGAGGTGQGGKEVAEKRGREAAREFYTNACMRAVNQAVGRAIRHKGDYAAIVLLDRRYGSTEIREKLPGWMKGSLRGGMGVGEARGQVEDFFVSKAEA